MNNKIIIAVVLILLLLGGIGFVLSQKSVKPYPGQTKMTTKEKAISPSTGSAMTSLKELMGMGKNQVCTFDYSDGQGGKTQGTTYIANGKIRNDFTNTIPNGQTVTGSMISDGTTVYTWSSATKQGMKIVMTSDMKKQVEDLKQNPNTYTDLEKKVDYQCQGRNVDTSKFIPPATIEFVDYSQTIPQQGGAGSKSAQCGACNNIPNEDQKATCRQALKC